MVAAAAAAVNANLAPQHMVSNGSQMPTAVANTVQNTMPPGTESVAQAPPPPNSAPNVQTSAPPSNATGQTPKRSSNGRAGKRNLSSDVVCILKNWYEEHNDWPYPNDAEQEVWFFSTCVQYVLSNAYVLCSS
jgi:hypothetical protein